MQTENGESYVKRIAVNLQSWIW